jgi:hypothetical protein
MEPIYWYALAYAVGTGFGFWIGHNYGVAKGVALTLATLVEGGYLKTRTMSDGELDLIKLTFEERLDDTAKTEDC